MLGIQKQFSKLRLRKEDGNFDNEGEVYPTLLMIHFTLKETQ